MTWEINMQTGTPILTYEGCSVIQDEQAHHALRAITEEPALRARVAELEKDLSGVIGELQRLQPGGSPPPGGPIILAGWIRQHVAKRILDLEEMLKSYD